MPKVLLISNNQGFVEDLRQQIELNLAGFEVVSDGDFDIIVTDIEDIAKKYPSTPSIIIKKPLVLNKFLDELEAVLSRFENSLDGFLSFNGYELRPNVKEIIHLTTNKTIKLTEKEVAIIKYLYKSQSKVVSKTELLEEVWGYNPDVSTHTIETHIYRLRQKFEDVPQIIETSDGGYHLVM